MGTKHVHRTNRSTCQHRFPTEQEIFAAKNTVGRTAAAQLRVCLHFCIAQRGKLNYQVGVWDRIIKSHFFVQVRYLRNITNELNVCFSVLLPVHSFKFKTDFSDHNCPIFPQILYEHHLIGREPILELYKALPPVIPAWLSCELIIEITLAPKIGLKNSLRHCCD
jgi:hypothetical protein